MATTLQHLRIEFSYHNSYVMAELVATTDFCIALDYLQLGFWIRGMLLQDWSHYYKFFMVVSMNTWIVTVYPSAPLKLICSMCHSCAFLFRVPRTWLFMSNTDKQRTLTLLVLLDHGLSFWWSLSCSFISVALCVLIQLFCLFCCICLFSSCGLCSWITFFWFPLESWIPWLLFLIKVWTSIWL